MVNFSEQIKKEKEAKRTDEQGEEIFGEVLGSRFPAETEAEKRKKEEEIFEKQELSEAEKEEREKLRQEIEKVRLPEEKQTEAVKEAETIKRQNVQATIKHLLALAQSKGLSFAIETARKMEDPYLLDLFHDTLVKEGLYKQFLSK